LLQFQNPIHTDLTNPIAAKNVGTSKSVGSEIYAIAPIPRFWKKLLKEIRVPNTNGGSFFDIRQASRCDETFSEYDLEDEEFDEEPPSNIPLPFVQSIQIK